MMKATIDGRLITDREELHNHLTQRLALSADYGRNLDALYDVLTSYPEKLEITVLRASEIVANLGVYGVALLETLQDAELECPNVMVFLENGNISK